MEFLLEINTEEMPALHVETALDELEKNLVEALVEHELVKHDPKKGQESYGTLRVYGSSRRLVLLGNLVERQKDKEEVVLGPPQSVAFDSQGSPTAAAIGFAKSQGIPVEQLDIISNNKGEYVGLKKIIRGIAAEDLLPSILPEIIGRLSFPKMMRWGNDPFRFSRPIKNIFCLLAGKPLIFKVGNITSSDFTTGHFIHSPEKLKVRSFTEYEKKLKQHFVIIDQEERKKMILKQVEKKLSSLDAEMLTDKQLLNKHIIGTEYPCVFMGSFSQEYLSLPIEVLSTAMKAGQNLFAVVKNKKQIPHFIGVADSPGDKKNLIRIGNERVLRARLEDAKFFWEQDSRINLKKRAKKLNQVIFQERLGNYEEKTLRLKKIVSYLVGKLEMEKEKNSASLAAELCKADLLTEMVREFPSLQGKIGGLYAREEGHPSPVWKAIYEHYNPVSLEDPIPASMTGAILSIADRIDSIVGVVGTGIEVTGSKDPFGLRRHAQGICKIILEKKIQFPLSRLLDKCIKTYDGKLVRTKDQIKAYILDFFKGRLQYIYESQGFRYDLINAALSLGVDNIFFSKLRLKALHSLKDSPQFEPMILIAKRVNNILKDHPPYRINEELFSEKEERDLYTTFTILQNNVQPFLDKGDFLKAQRIVFRMRSEVDNFFDNVLVMVDDKRIRQNRLALLQMISNLLIQIADYSQVVVEGEI